MNPMIPHRNVLQLSQGNPLVRARCAGAAFASVAGQSVERGGPDPGVGIVGHGDELTH
jgi:hypothetical protein